MEAARPRTRGPRLRRGTVERPLNARLVRIGFVVVVPALLALLFSISTTTALPRSPLEPLFDEEAAAAYASTLATEYPSRVPGSEGAAGAARWYRETVSSIGLETDEDVWVEDLADLGQVELRNVVTTVRGRSDDTILVVAHRDNAGAERAYGENASGTALMIELARSFAPQDAGPDPLPQHTIALVSTDAGAFGGAGSRRLATVSPLARNAIAVVVLADLGAGQPRLAIAGDDPVSPARALVRTAALRVVEEAGSTPRLPSVPTQLVDLGLPFALGEQGRFLASGLSAVTLTTEGGESRSPVADRQLGQLGRAVEALVASLDASVGVAFRTPDSLYFSDRAASGWTARLALILAVVPFALGTVDLIVRGRRWGLPFAPALRAQRTRLGVWAFGGLLVWLGALLGILPTGAPLPLQPDSFAGGSVLGVLVLTGAFVLGWLTARVRLAARRGVVPEERLAGLVVGLGLLGCVAVGFAVLHPYALVFVIPSLYAWLWLPLSARVPWRIVVYAVGFVGPLAGMMLLGDQLEMSAPDAGVYVLGLFTVGYLPLASGLLAILWAAAATQIGALAFGRYGPYAAGAEPPPPGPLRRALTRRAE